MASISEIIQADNYKGQDYGSGMPAITIDNNPLFQLAHYTQAYNKNMWEQRVVDRDAKIQEVAKISQVDLNNLRGNDREQVTKQLDEIKKYAIDYAKNPSRSVTQELEWQGKLHGLLDNYTSGKGRALTYYDQVNDIQSKYQNPKEQEVRLKSLNSRFDNTDISVPIPSQSGYVPVEIKIPDAPVSPFSTIKVGDNEDVTLEGKFYNPLAAAQKSMTVSLGLDTLYNQGGETGDLQNTSASEAKVWQDSAATFNSVLTARNPDGSYKYFTPDGAFNPSKFETENAANTVIMQPYNALKAQTEYSKNKIAQVQSGVFNDGKFSFAVPSTVTADTFKPGIVEITTSGVKPEQIVQAGIFSKYGGDVIEKKVQQTDNAIQKSAQEVTKRGQTLDYKAAMARVKQDKDELDAKKDQWKATQTGGETVKNGALMRAQRIFADLKTLADKNGIISPDKLRQLNAEQLKYLGSEEVITGENRIPHSVYKPLELGDGQTEFAIQLNANGDIRVLKPKGESKTLERFGNGGFAGQWDNTRSTNLLNVGTNILNEELQKAGSKELNSFLPIDSANQEAPVSTNQTGGGTSQSGSTQVRVDASGNITEHAQPSAVELSGKIDPSNLKVNQSYSVGGKTYIWNGKKLKAQ